MFEPTKIRAKNRPLQKVPKRLSLKKTSGNARLGRPKKKSPCGCGG